MSTFSDVCPLVHCHGRDDDDDGKDAADDGNLSDAGKPHPFQPTATGASVCRHQAIIRNKSVYSRRVQHTHAQLRIPAGSYAIYQYLVCANMLVLVQVYFDTVYIRI